MNQNLKATLKTITYSEIGEKLLSVSDNGYNVIVGGSLFHDYSDHPRKRVLLTNWNLWSTAAGAYQIKMGIFDFYKVQLKLLDFSPDSQDAIAIQLINECHAMPDILSGNIRDALYRCKSRWASLPNAGYSQHENKMVDLLEYYSNNNGALLS